jgi:hypothetical protein
MSACNWEKWGCTVPRQQAAAHARALGEAQTEARAAERAAIVAFLRSRDHTCADILAEYGDRPLTSDPGS